MTATLATVPLSPPADPHSGGSCCLITCSVDELHPHPSLVRHNLVPTAQELSLLAERGELAFREPLTITQDHAILDGMAQWQLARMQGRTSLLCHQHDMTEEEALLWLLQKQQRSAGLNHFSRVLLALELESWFKQQARNNQQLGGRIKGSSNLPEADRLDVREKIAEAAGVSVGNVSKVKRLLEAARPELLQALRIGEVSIHRAAVWLSHPEKQLHQLRLYQNLRGITRTIQSLQRRHQLPHPDGEGKLDIRRIGSALATLSAERRAAILVSAIQVPGDVLLLSPSLLEALETQGELSHDAA